MDGLIKCILLTDSAEVIFIINNLSSISVNKTSKMCLQKKKSQLRRVTGFTNVPVCNILIKKTILSKMCLNTKQNILTEIFEY